MIKKQGSVPSSGCIQFYRRLTTEEGLHIPANYETGLTKTGHVKNWSCKTLLYIHASSLDLT